MKLQQLRYIIEVVNNNLNVSSAAESLYTSQPGISKQIRMLEDELGIQVFTRNGKHLTQITPAGQSVLKLSEEILAKVEAIKAIANEYTTPDIGSFNIGATHNQICYTLPKIIKDFMDCYPKVSLHMHQGSTHQVTEAIMNGTVNFVITSETLEKSNDLLMLPCYQWKHSIITKYDHPLAKQSKITIKDLANYQIITNTSDFNRCSKLDKSFSEAGINAKTVYTATDTDLIKTYVNLDIGIGVVANASINLKDDKNLISLDASHLFEPTTTKIAFRRNAFLRNYMYDFIQRLAPHLTKELVDSAVTTKSDFEVNELMKNISLPIK